MPQVKLSLRPGINTQASQTQNEGGWSFGNLIRWRDGFLEKIAGWMRLFSSACNGYVRGLHAWADLDANKYLLIGGEDRLELYNGTTLYTVRAPVETQDIATANLTGTAGTSTVQVVYAGHGLSTGDIIAFPIAVYLTNTASGVALYPGTTYAITVIDASTYTFDSGTITPTNITSGNAAAYNTTAASTTVAVVFRGHGLTTGDIWTVHQTTTIGSTVINAGDYVATVSGVNNFTIELLTAATDSGGNREGGNSSTIPVQTTSENFPDVQNWSIDNFGENAVFCYNNGPLSQWTPPVVATNIATLISTGPTINGGVLVAMPQAQVISFRAETSGTQDPLLLRWSDVGTMDIWGATSSNQAGSFRLSRGSLIVGALQAPQSTLVWTDIDLWSMQYTGPPFVYSFNIVAMGCGLIAQRARCVLNGITYWMGPKNFFSAGGSGVAPLPCTVWDEVFSNLSTSATAQAKIIAGANSAAQEVWWFYPSDDGSGEIDSYAKVNVVNGLWDYGSLVRTAWIDENVFGRPLGADENYRIQQHERGFDDDGDAMEGAFAETGFIDLGDGTEIIFVDQIIPDFKWFGDDGYVSLTIYAKNYPGEKAVKLGPFTVTEDTRFIFLRKRARQISFRITWGAFQGFSARLGAMRYRGATSGRRP